MMSVRHIDPIAPSLAIDDPAALLAIASKLAQLGSDHLATIIEAGIAILDHRAGDPDLEDGDADGQCSEDEISCGGQTRDWLAHASRGAGCIFSDNDTGERL